MKAFFYFFLAVTLILIAPILLAPIWSVPRFCCVAAERDKKVDPSYETLKEQYKVLLNRQPELATEPQWVALIGELNAFSQTRAQTATELAARAAFASAVLGEQLANSGLPSSARYQKTVVSQFETVEHAFKNTSVADDALLRAAQYYRAHLERNDNGLILAAALEEKILRVYSTSDSALALRVGKGETTQTTAKGQDKKVLVIIDPGHGGEDFGAEGPGGILEKDLAFLISLELQQELKKLGLEAQLTREGDTFVSLKSRVEMANERAASIFVSIHCNASLKGTARGFETYYFGTKADQKASHLATLENKQWPKEKPTESAQVLEGMLGQIKTRESKLLADELHASLVKQLTKVFPDFVAAKPRTAPFYVLEETQMPAVLIEIGYIDSPQESSRLLDKKNRTAYANALATSILGFLNK